METTDTNNFVNFYDVLQCEKTATTEDIKKKYRQLVRSNHPDKKISSKEADEAFLIIQKAWTVLRDPVTRKQYDAEMSYRDNNGYLILNRIGVKDMTFNMQNHHFEYACKCGGLFSIAQPDLHYKYYKVVTGCNDCSYFIEINVLE